MLRLDCTVGVKIVAEKNSSATQWNKEPSHYTVGCAQRRRGKCESSAMSGMSTITIVYSATTFGETGGGSPPGDARPSGHNSG